MVPSGAKCLGWSQKHAQLCTAGARVSDDMYHVDIRGSGPELARFSYRCHVRIAQLFDILDDESCDFNAIA